MLFSSNVWAQSVYVQPRCATGSSGSSVGGQTAKAMTEAAEGAFNRDAKVFEEYAKQQANGIEQSMGCVGQVTQTVNSVIPSFGGGLVSSVAQNLVKNLASEACQLVQRVSGGATQAINQNLGGALGQLGQIQNIGSQMGLSTPGFNGQGTLPLPGVQQQSGSGSASSVFQSVTQAMSGLF